MGVCGYCGVISDSTYGRNREAVHGINCPFTPESERQIRKKLEEVEERLDFIENILREKELHD